MSGNPSNLNLLLAEDDENDAFFFRRTLRLSGIECHLEHVINGASAIEYLQTQAAAKTYPRVLFLDLKMPIANGFDVLEWMKTQEFPSPIEIIVLSGSDQQQDKDRSRGNWARSITW